LKAGRKTILTEDGTTLEVKEAAVLDPEGNTLARPSGNDSTHTFGAGGKVKILKLGPWATPIVLFLAGAAITVGVIFVGSVFVILFAIVLIRMILQWLLGPKR
jgi:hypothetical protein